MLTAGRAEDRPEDPPRHARMPLEYLWVWFPCRRPVRRPPSPREDAPEVPVGGVAVAKTGQSIGKLPFLDRSAGGSPHWDGSEVHEGRVAVPNPVANLTIITSTVPISFPSPRNPASELSVAGGAVPKTGQKPSSPRDNLYPMGPARFPCARDHTPL